MIFAALAMLVLAAIALPMATIALSRSAQKTTVVDGERVSPPTTADQLELGSDPAAAR
ncbi:MAG TPA: hypothetical protein VGD48_35475 [Kutzneria sp.]